MQTCQSPSVLFITRCIRKQCSSHRFRAASNPKGLPQGRMAEIYTVKLPTTFKKRDRTKGQHRPSNNATIKTGQSRVRVVFYTVCTVVVTVLPGTSFVDRFVRGIFPLKRKIVHYSSELVPILSFNDLAEEHNDRDEKHNT